MKKAKIYVERKYLPTLAELIDSLTINQIKQLKFRDKREVYAKEIKKIGHDIDLILKERRVKINSKVIRAVALIAEINLSIWENKDMMQKASQDDYLKFLKHAHQLNGIRNAMKNKISEMIGDNDLGKRRTNVETDGFKI